jgi:genome maintenance exonuclease 1
MTLLTERYDYTPLDRASVDGKRLYATPDGNKLPSVTTILDKTKPWEKVQALLNWKKAVGEAKAQEIVTEAASRGTRMHKYLEDYITQGTLNDPGTNPYSIQSHKMAKHIIEHGLKNVNEVWGVEVGLYYPGLYAGTTDCVGLHLGEGAIMDHKQTNKPKKDEWIEDYYLQMVAYALAHNEVHKTNIRKGVVFMCVKPPEIGKTMTWGDPAYQEFILTPDKFDHWEKQWWNRVEQYYREN